MAEEDSQRRVENLTRIVLRPLASPLPLGFFAFGIGSILQSGLQFGLLPQSEVQNLALIFGALVFPLELLAAILAFPSRETAGATVLSIIAFSPTETLSSRMYRYRIPRTPLSGCSS